ncbi:F0F1 ATP synthase subunit B [Patescibacteria group bacterium]|nr:F0F1 ATP synthase subunit B [Patescibacteria group bacterium]MBU1473014.1 F0F1 ATP synthase subunit B [Patescibacteria group bacterium]MBU2460349.1 F0F1 ATP synthase subunit B [Patescibacteria group bacterium]
MEQLGIEPKLLLAQIINFCIIVVVLSKLLYKPILGMLEKRKKEIADNLVLAEKLHTEEEKLKLKRQEVIDAAKQEGLMVIEEAKKQASKEGKDIVAEAHKQSDETIRRAKAESERIYEETQMNIRKESVNVAAAMAKRLLSSILSPGDQRKLITMHIKEIEDFAKKQQN